MFRKQSDKDGYYPLCFQYIVDTERIRDQVSLVHYTVSAIFFVSKCCGDMSFSTCTICGRGWVKFQRRELHASSPRCAFHPIRTDQCFYIRDVMGALALDTLAVPVDSKPRTTLKVAARK